MLRVSAPCVLLFAGWAWPLGPGRVTVQAAPRSGGLRSLVRDPERGLQLWVDPTLPAPSVEEGPLGCEARLLRAHPPAVAHELVSEGPRPPRPGADAARGLALRVALGADATRLAPASPSEAAALSGLPCAPAGPAEPAAAAAAQALLAARLVLYEDLVARLREEPPAPEPAAPVPLADLGAWLESARGHGLGSPARSPRARQLEEALRGAGLQARWPLGDGLTLVLCAPEDRDRLRAALTAHGLTVLPCALVGVPGLHVSPEEAA